jgi:preprotein translocase subunit SecE
MAQFFNEMKRYSSVRIMHSTLEADPKKFKILSYISQARNEYLHKARKIPAESEAISYLTFSEDLERVLNHDELTCQLFFNLYNLLCSSKPESQHISKILTKLYKATNFTLSLYRYLNIKFSRNSKIANYYMGFKDFINMHDIKDNTHSVSQLVAHHKESSSKEQDLQYFDLKSVVFFIDLETEIGKIIWVRNPEVIGYTEIELEHTSVLSLFIEPISNVIAAYLNTLRDVWNEENVFQSRQQVYVKSHNEFLVPVLMKGSTVNLEDGKLVLMMVLKPSLDGKEAAFMTDDGRFVRHATKDMKILLCRLLNIEPQDLNKFDFLNYIEIDKWEDEVEVYKEVDIRTKSTIIIKTFENSLLNIPAKMLVLTTNTDESLIHKVDFKQLAKRIRSIRICSVVDQKIYSIDVSHSQANNPVSGMNSTPLIVCSEERLSASVQSASINIRNQTKHSLRSFTKRRASMLKIGLFIYVTSI